MTPSIEQNAIIDAPLKPLSVIACAGSGKTATAIRRVVKMRKDLGDARGRVALLSFSNVAVNTFREGYRVHSQTLPQGPARERVDIDTLDGFIATHILRPHAHRTMKSKRSAFLVTGDEDFLENYSYKGNNGEYPIGVSEIKVGINGDKFEFFRSFQNTRIILNEGKAKSCIERLGETGAYTYDLGRYWCFRVLATQKLILKALVRRYPHILVDEAQDIGQMHQLILELLIQAGAEVSLIGDPHQGIYEFAGADGQFLATYKAREGVKELPLTTNYRSLPVIVSIANALSGRGDTAKRGAEPAPKGAYYIGYDEAEIPKLVDMFHAEVVRQKINHSNAAILCRSNKHTAKIAGSAEAGGLGLTKAMASAAVLRDGKADYLGAYRLVCRVIVSLLTNAPNGLLSKLSNASDDDSIRVLRRKVWEFVRDPNKGLPNSALNARNTWHPQMVINAKRVLAEIGEETDYEIADNVGRRLAVKELKEAALNAGLDLAAQNGPRIRAETVHQVKGESIDAVLYIAGAAAAKAMINGVDTEDGRVGYVAVTRARDLLWVAIPNGTLTQAVKKRLHEIGFQQAGGGV